MTALAEAVRVVAVSARMRALLDVALRVAEAKSPVLLLGESGCGASLLAHWIHAHGPRRDLPFVTVHCPSIPEDLLESELFGHERGAFTDAKQGKQGKLEMASGGTLFFDRLEALSPVLQAKLLRAVEERAFERVGGTRTLEVDVRFISAAPPDLRASFASGRFREDLYHRLAVVPVELPPLRERKEDIPALAELFLSRVATPRSGARRFTEEALSALRAYHWPGNVRELRSVVERVCLAGDGDITREDLPKELFESPETLWAGRPLAPTLRDVERTYIEHVLRSTDGSQTKAAAILGISRKALWEKRRRFGLG